MRLFYIILCVTFILDSSYAQNKKIDSLVILLKTAKEDTNKVKILNALIWQYFITSNFDDSKKYAIQSITLSDKIKFLKGKAEALNYLGNIYAQTTQYPEALEKYFASLEIKKQIGDTISMGATYNNIGNVLWNLGNLSEAISYHLKALKIREKVGNQDNIAQSYSNIGLIYLTQKKYNQALKYFKKAEALQYNIGNKYSLAITYNNIGNVYERTGEIQKSLEYHLKAKKYREEIGDKYGLSQSYANIGVIYRHSNLKLSNEYFLKSLRISIEIGDRNNEVLNNINLASNTILEKNFKVSKNYADRAFKIAKEIKSIELLQQVYFLYYSLDKISANWKSALNNFDKYIAYRDSLINQENSNKILMQQMQYDFDKKTALMQEQRLRERELALADKKRQKIFIYFSVGGILVLTIFLIVLNNRFKLTIKQKNIIEQQKQLVEEKNKEITDSINYAKRIQEAILPNEQKWEELLPQSFILYLPKDIVAGDFYWMEETEDYIFIAAADSTGHGVPGAMVSVVCSGALSKAVREEHLVDTGKILDKAREIVTEQLSSGEQHLRDGMDVCLVRIDKNNSKSIQYSGANRSLILIRNGEVIEIKADKQPVGFDEDAKMFAQHDIELQNGDSVYLFTDGYADQFGGEKSKKIGNKRFLEMLKEVSQYKVQERGEKLQEVFTEWKKEQFQVDDVTVIGIDF